MNRPKNWKFSDDLIKDQACQALYESPAVDAAEIEVFVKDGVVTLSGKVKDDKQKSEAENCVELMSEVVKVVNELRVA
jgi:osmotically-inducible protein OsmY